MPRTKKETTEKIENQTTPLTLETLMQALKPITDRLETVESAIRKPITSEVRSLHEESKPQAPEQIFTSPVPSDWVREVHMGLNQDFGVEIDLHPEAPVTTFTVIVPDKYSTMSAEQRQVMKRDIRPKVITNAGGINEIKEWVSKVFTSFSPEYQAMIVADRKA